MKKTIFFMIAALCAFLIPERVQAQSAVTFGPKVALTYSNLLSSDRRINEDAFVGLAGGAFVRIKMGRAYLQPEGYFTTKGTNLTFSSDPNDPNNTEARGKVRLSSFDVPLLLGVRLVDKKSFNIRLMGGPVASFLLHEDRNDLSLLDTKSYSYNKSNIGFQAGLGFDIGNLTFDARYESGLNAINSGFNQRTSLFQFGVGFKIL
jgi:hypothetical protein